jgi:hypothetical protein
MTRFKSKIDRWLAIVVAGSATLSVFAAAVLLGLGGSQVWWLAGVLLITGCGLPLWILFGTWYQLEGQVLQVRSGPFRWYIRVLDIQKLVPASSLRASPALSMDRLRIEYGSGRALLVSPVSRPDFVAALIAAGRTACSEGAESARSVSRKKISPGPDPGHAGQAGPCVDTESNEPRPGYRQPD